AIHAAAGAYERHCLAAGLQHVTEYLLSPLEWHSVDAAVMSQLQEVDRPEKLRLLHDGPALGFRVARKQQHLSVNRDSQDETGIVRSLVDCEEVAQVHFGDLVA